VAFLIVVFLALFFGVRGEIPIWALVGIAAVVVVAALLAANYDRAAALESGQEILRTKLQSVAEQYRSSTHQIVAVYNLLHHLIDGHDLLSDLADSIKTGVGSRPELRGRVDAWESDTDRSIAKWCDPSELDLYRRPLAPVVLTGKWEQDLFEQVNVRLSRLAAIQERTRQAFEKWLEGAK
jgi:hypothetical protein